MNKSLARTALVLALTTAMAPSLFAQTIKKCVDDKGITHYGDPLPPQCAKSEVKEITSQGTVRKTIDRPLTAEEIKARQEDELRNKDARRKEEEQNRRDRALLATYGSEKEFDVSRDRGLATIDARINTSRTQLKDLEDQKKKLAGEMEFYESGKSKSTKGKEVPAALADRVARNKKDIQNINTSIVRLEEEKKLITEQFEADKQRWRELKTGKATLKLEDRKLGVQGKAICNGTEYTCTVGVPYICTEIDNYRLRRRYIECKNVK